MTPASSKEFLDIQANYKVQIHSETVRNMIITYSQMKILILIICSAYSYAPVMLFLQGHNFHFISISNNLSLYPHNQLKYLK